MNPKPIWKLLLCCIVLSCNDAAEQQPAKALNDSTNHTENREPSSSTESSGQIISLPEQTAAVIATRKWELPAGDWSKASKNTYSDTIQFDKVKAAVIVSFTALNADSSYVISELSIRSYKEDNNYTVTARISDQINMGTQKAFNTYVMADFTANLKPGRRSTQKLEGKSVVAYAKDGTITPL